MKRSPNPPTVPPVSEPTLDVVALLIRAMDADPVAIEAVAVATIIDAVLPPGKNIVWRLAARDGWACAYCERPLGWGHEGVQPPQVEHKVPKARGGSSHPDDLCLACQPCNLAKATKTDEEFWTYRLERSAAGVPLPWTPEGTYRDVRRAGVLPMLPAESLPLEVWASRACEEDAAGYWPEENDGPACWWPRLSHEDYMRLGAAALARLEAHLAWADYGMGALFR